MVVRPETQTPIVRSRTVKSRAQAGKKREDTASFQAECTETSTAGPQDNFKAKAKAASAQRSRPHRKRRVFIAAGMNISKPGLPQQQRRCQTRPDSLHAAAIGDMKFTGFA
tara:strand:- start:76 stop:408 length:333 start_codon:yes stop_codon:yes gene_type:complete